MVKKGKAKKIVEITKNAGAEGGTTLFGRGTSVKEFNKVFGINMDSQREVILTLVEENNIDTVFKAILQRGELYKPGAGICFVIDVKQVAGIAHLLKGGKN